MTKCVLFFVGCVISSSIAIPLSSYSQSNSESYQTASAVGVQAHQAAAQQQAQQLAQQQAQQATQQQLQECPKDFEYNFGDKCIGNTTCTTGQECCCGKCYPSFQVECSGGRMMGFHTHKCWLPECELDQIRARRAEQQRQQHHNNVSQASQQQQQYVSQQQTQQQQVQQVAQQLQQQSQHQEPPKMQPPRHTGPVPLLQQRMESNPQVKG